MGRILFAFLILMFGVASSSAQTTASKKEQAAGKTFTESTQTFTDFQTNALPTAPDTSNLENLFNNPDSINGCSGNADCQDLFNRMSNAQTPDLDGALDLVERVTVTEDPMEILGEALMSSLTCVAGTEAEIRTSTEYFEYRCNSGRKVSESEGSCDLVLVHEIREGFVYECDVIQNDDGTVTVSDECEVIQSEPSCVLTNSTCAVQGGDSFETISCRVGDATVSGETSCSETLVHELKLLFSYECDFLWNADTQQFEPDPQCSDLIKDPNCTKGNESCSEDRPPDTEEHVCATGEELTYNNTDCTTVIETVVDEDYGYDVRRVWNSSTKKHDGRDGYYFLQTKGCEITGEHCSKPAPIITEEETCQIGYYFDVTTETCLMERVVTVDTDYFYKAERSWSDTNSSHTPTTEWTALNASCVKEGTECTTATPPEYSYYTCERGYRDNVEPISCDIPRNVTVDVDYKYRGVRSWNGGNFVLDATLQAAQNDDDCTVTRAERCVQSSPGVYETATCEKGYSIDYINETVNRDLLITTDEDYVYYGFENWNDQTKKFDKTSLLQDLEANGAPDCKSTGRTCTQPSGGVQSQHVCRVGYQLNYQNKRCEIPLNVSVDNDYLYQADREFSRTLNRWINSSQLDALKSADTCEFQSQHCVQESPGVFSSFTCNQGYNQTFSTHVASRFRKLVVDEDYIYKFNRTWDGSTHRPEDKWTQANSDATCEKTGTSCTVSTPVEYDQYSCRSGYRDYFDTLDCEIPREVTVDSDYIYTVDRQYDYSNKRWTGTGDWNAVRNAGSVCVKQSATCDVSSPGVFSTHTCQEGYVIDDKTDSCVDKLSFTVETDYRYTGYETWNGSSYVRDATLRNIDSQKSTKSCVRESRVAQQPHTDLTSSYECLVGWIDYETNRSCKVTRDVTVTNTTLYHYKVRDIFDTLSDVPNCTVEGFEIEEVNGGFCEGGESPFGGTTFGDNCVGEQHIWVKYQCTTPQSATGVVSLGTSGSIDVSETINDSYCAPLKQAGMTKVSEVCTSGPATRTINGHPVTRDCWQWNHNYKGTTRAQINQCQPPSGYTLKTSSSVNPYVGVARSLTKRRYEKVEALSNASRVQGSFNCIQGSWWNGKTIYLNQCDSRPSGSVLKNSHCLNAPGQNCTINAHTYVVPRPGPANGYKRYEEKWKCDKAVTGSGVATPQYLRSRKAWVWDKSQCNAMRSGYSNGCTQTSARYIGPSVAKTIDGLTITRQWDYERTYTCSQRRNINTCTSLLSVNEIDDKTIQFASNTNEPVDLKSLSLSDLIPDFELAQSGAKSNAVMRSGEGNNSPPIVYAAVGDWTYEGRVCTNYEGSTCTLWKKTYKREETDGSGGCADQSEVWRCENAVSGAGTAQIVKHVLTDKWGQEPGFCAAVKSEFDSCTLVSETEDTSSGGTRVIDGLSVNRSSWQKIRQYDCQMRNHIETCSPAAGFTYYDSSCLWQDSSGVCRLLNKKYRKPKYDPTGGCTTYTDTFACENRSYGTPASTTHEIISNTFPLGDTQEYRSRGCVRKSYQWKQRETRVVNGYSYNNYWELEETFECEDKEFIDTCTARSQNDYIVPGTPELTYTHHAHAPNNTTPVIDRAGVSYVSGNPGILRVDLSDRDRKYIGGTGYHKVEIGDTVSLNVDVKYSRKSTNNDRFLMGFVAYNADKSYQRMYWAWKTPSASWQKFEYKFTKSASHTFTYLRPLIDLDHYYTSSTSSLDGAYELRNMKFAQYQKREPELTSKTCSKVDRDGACIMWRHTYRQEEDDPSGGCLKFREEYLCEVEVPAAGQPTGVPSEVNGTEWNESACEIYASDDHCTLIEEACVEGPETRIISGLAVTKQCWKRAKVYECSSQKDTDTCSAYFKSNYIGPNPISLTQKSVWNGGSDAIPTLHPAVTYVDVTVPTFKVDTNLNPDSRIFIGDRTFHQVEGFDQFKVSVEARHYRATTNSIDRFLIGFGVYDQDKNYLGVKWAWRNTSSGYGTYNYILNVPEFPDYKFVRPVIDVDHYYANTDRDITSGFYFRKYTVQKTKQIDDESVLTNERCLWTDRSGMCQLFERTYENEEHDPSGGCHQYKTDYRCETKFKSYPVNDTIIHELSSKWDYQPYSDMRNNADPAYNRCVYKSSTCTEGRETRNINGLDITKSCWQRDFLYECERKDVKDTCNFAHPYTETSKRCLWYDRTNICQLYEHTVRLQLPDPSGGCHRYETEFVCKDQLSGSGHNVVEYIRTVESDSFDTSQCSSAIEGQGSCRSVAETCIEGQSTKTIDGLAVTRSCWKKKRNYDCTTRDNIDTCDIPPGSISNGNECLWEDSNGVCRLFEEKYKKLLPDPTGGCTTYTDTFRCENTVANGGTYFDTVKHVQTNRYDTSTCSFDAGNRDCYQSSEICTEGRSTRIIDGLEVTQDCWERKRTYTCEERINVDTCTSIPVSANLVTKTCETQNSYGQCILENRTYSWEVDDGSGGCHEYSAVAWCENKEQEGVEHYRYSYGQSRETEASCPTRDIGSNCVRVSKTCNDNDPRRRVPSNLVYADGFPFSPEGPGPNTEIEQSCWGYDYVYECEDRTPVNSCNEFINDSDCKLQSTICAQKDRRGNCAKEEHIYNCTIEGTGGCIKQTTEFTCEGIATSSNGQLTFGKPYLQSDGPSTGSGGYTPTNIRAEVIGRYWDKAECAIAPNDPQCELVATNCIASGVGGPELPRTAQDDWHQGYIQHAELVTEDCFEQEKVYNCTASSDLNACGSNVESCSVTSEKCIFYNSDGTCALSENKYSCREDDCQSSRAVCDPRKDNAFYSGHKYTCFSRNNRGVITNTCSTLSNSCRKVVTDRESFSYFIDGPNTTETDVTEVFAYYCDEEQSDVGKAFYVGFVQQEGSDATHSDCSAVPSDCQLISEVCLTENTTISTDGFGGEPINEDFCQGLKRQVFECSETSNDSGSCSGQCQEWNEEYTCENAPDGVTPIDNEDAVILSTVDSSQCRSYEDSSSCVLQNESCVEGPATRIVEGVPVYAECWLWSRDYKCEEDEGFESDCEVEDNCEFSHDECLGYSEDGECLTVEHVYQCSITEEYEVSPAVAGTCEEDGTQGGSTVPYEDERTGSGFSEVVASLMSVEEAGLEYHDPQQPSIFEGEDKRCGKWIFGSKNCCKRTGFFESLFGCSEGEKELAVARNENQCVYVGSYCSKKALFGSCLKKSETYCCYKSEFAKLVAEAGKEQIGKSMGSAKSPDCSGFSVTEFQRLDLSRVDFSSVTADIVSQMEIDPEAIKERMSNQISNMQNPGG